MSSTNVYTENHQAQRDIVKIVTSKVNSYIENPFLKEKINELEEKINELEDKLVSLAEQFINGGPKLEELITDPEKLSEITDLKNDIQGNPESLEKSEGKIFIQIIHSKVKKILANVDEIICCQITSLIANDILQNYSQTMIQLTIGLNGSAVKQIDMPEELDDLMNYLGTHLWALKGIIRALLNNGKQLHELLTLQEKESNKELTKLHKEFTHLQELNRSLVEKVSEQKKIVGKSEEHNKKLREKTEELNKQISKQQEDLEAEKTNTVNAKNMGKNKAVENSSLRKELAEMQKQLIEKSEELIEIQKQLNNKNKSEEKNQETEENSRAFSEENNRLKTELEKNKKLLEAATEKNKSLIQNNEQRLEKIKQEGVIQKNENKAVENLATCTQLKSELLDESNSRKEILSKEIKELQLQQSELLENTKQLRKTKLNLQKKAESKQLKELKSTIKSQNQELNASNQKIQSQDQKIQSQDQKIQSQEDIIKVLLNNQNLYSQLRAYGSVYYPDVFPNQPQENLGYTSILNEQDPNNYQYATHQYATHQYPTHQYPTHQYPTHQMVYWPLTPENYSQLLPSDPGQAWWECPNEQNYYNVGANLGFSQAQNPPMAPGQAASLSNCNLQEQDTNFQIHNNNTFTGNQTNFFKKKLRK